jgi:hypothetical protein
MKGAAASRQPFLLVQMNAPIATRYSPGTHPGLFDTSVAKALGNGRKMAQQMK